MKDVDNRACVRIGNEVSEWFSVNVGVSSRLCHVNIVDQFVYGWGSAGKKTW